MDIQKFSDGQLLLLLADDSADRQLFLSAERVRRAVYGDGIFIRGLIEISNHCRNNCYYCGIRRGNTHLERYRLSQEQIFECAAAGYSAGFRTFVLQGGEDAFFTDEIVCAAVSRIKNRFPDCAVTLSLGERTAASYKRFFDAGASRYLLRQESADSIYYSRLHPPCMSHSRRIECLLALKEIGFQVGAGFMVGSPYQSAEHIVREIRFMQELSPDMIGIGPFISHRHTPFARAHDGSLRLTLKLIAVMRLFFPHALIPATTALASVDRNGRKDGLLAGANVVMPDLTPPEYRDKYQIYRNKAYSGADAAGQVESLCEEVSKLGYRIVIDKGDVKR